MSVLGFGDRLNRQAAAFFRYHHALEALRRLERFERYRSWEAFLESDIDRVPGRGVLLAAFVVVLVAFLECEWIRVPALAMAASPVTPEGSALDA